MAKGVEEKRERGSDDLAQEVQKEIEKTEESFAEALKNVCQRRRIDNSEILTFQVLKKLVAMGAKTGAKDEFSLEQKLRMMREAWGRAKRYPDN